MYSKQEASQARQAFWTAFGQYMSPVKSADDEKVNWINYKTGEKDVYLRMHADNKKGMIAIEITHSDLGIQQIFFEQFEQLKNFFREIVQEDWTWELHSTNEYGKTTSRIYKEVEDVNIFKKEDWPTLISFFKQRIILLDQFWSMVKYSFEALH